MIKNRRYLSIFHGILVGISLTLEWQNIGDLLLTGTFAMIAITNLMMAIWWLE